MILFHIKFYNYQKSIGLILLHDQIIRHIYRDNKDKDKIQIYLNLIINFAEITYIKFKCELKPDHYCFVLLPLRHNNKFDKILYVISETRKHILYYPHIQVYKQFLKATLERYIKLTDDVDNIILYEPFIQENIVDDAQICELELRKYFPLKIELLFNISFFPLYIKNIIDKIQQNTHIQKGIISLSGGVDSMVLSYILKMIDIDIIAVHINYNNRPECNDECEILKQWCSFLNIKLYIRKIIEIQRPEMMEFNMRDIYETFTRDIRFNTYLYADVDYNNVFLGHNNDDQFENIFTNIISESHLNNLCGMSNEMTLKFKDKNINFVRPMLDISKADIYKFSTYFSIPHFKDSTPKWSQRGKIRDIIRPAIEQLDDIAVSSFFKLSDKISDLIKIAQFSAQNICEQINLNKILDINLDNIYPKTLFETIFEKLHIKVSQKGLSSFYDKLIFIKKNKKKYKINSVGKYRFNYDTEIKWKNLSDNNIQLIF